ncbi:hypothetical protein [Rubellimicrobium aerolatum]|uniref:Uncharacterized protein n=1 Tax=Rubellimicrobium aerolatum TaxID=490979 RepID=A0ABW0SCY5_9RHOB|nr:hypothetical protein [Rubellimicrobium aerolatum]MBP1806581.1 hypothetical protein [Rubellimicrobium aerolatum]
MQITLNKVPFEVVPVDGATQAALMAEPAIRQAGLRPVWAWSKAEGKGRFLVNPLPDGALTLPTGVSVYVPKAGVMPLQRADGPTTKMGERFLAAVGAKNFGQVMQAVARITGVPKKTLPLKEFAELNDKADYTIVMHTDFSVLELANAARNLSAYVVLPGLVTFLHTTAEVVEGAPRPGAIRPGFVIPAGNQAALTMRRLAVARRLTEFQAELGGKAVADLPLDDPRRFAIAKLGIEWKVLQTKAAKAA